MRALQRRRVDLRHRLGLTTGVHHDNRPDGGIAEEDGAVAGPYGTGKPHGSRQGCDRLYRAAGGGDLLEAVTEEKADPLAIRRRKGPTGPSGSGSGCPTS